MHKYPSIDQLTDNPLFKRCFYKLKGSFDRVGSFSPFLFTSAEEDEGKTIVASAMAATYALKTNVPCLLMDGNWSKPQLDNIFHLQRNYTIDQLTKSPKECVQKTGYAGLHVLTAPKWQNNELHYSDISDQLKETLTKLYSGFKAVFIDGSAVFPQSHPNIDPLFLTPFANSIILVVKARKTKKQQVKKAMISLRDVHNKMSGVIVNNIDNSFY